MFSWLHRNDQRAKSIQTVRVKRSYTLVGRTLVRHTRTMGQDFGRRQRQLSHQIWLLASLRIRIIRMRRLRLDMDLQYTSGQERKGSKMDYHMEKAFLDRLPDKLEIENAEQLRRIVASQIKDDEPTNLVMAKEDGSLEKVVLMPALAATLLELLRLVSSGHSFRMTPVETELTTQQAADLLNVSRHYLVELLEQGEIPFSKIGRHRRVRAEDLFAYKKKRDKIRANALSELARMDAEHGLL